VLALGCADCAASTIVAAGRATVPTSSKEGLSFAAERRV
jgi:hypothetical protein